MTLQVLSADREIMLNISLDATCLRESIATMAVMDIDPLTLSLSSSTLRLVVEDSVRVETILALQSLIDLPENVTSLQFEVSKQAFRPLIAIKDADLRINILLHFIDEEIGAVGGFVLSCKAFEVSWDAKLISVNSAPSPLLSANAVVIHTDAIRKALTWVRPFAAIRSETQQNHENIAVNGSVAAAGSLSSARSVTTDSLGAVVLRVHRRESKRLIALLSRFTSETTLSLVNDRQIFASEALCIQVPIAAAGLPPVAWQESFIEFDVTPTELDSAIRRISKQVRRSAEGVSRPSNIDLKVDQDLATARLTSPVDGGMASADFVLAKEQLALDRSGSFEVSLDRSGFLKCVSIGTSVVRMKIREDKRVLALDQNIEGALVATYVKALRER